MHTLFYSRRLLESEEFCIQHWIKRVSTRTKFDLYTKYCHMLVRRGWGVSTCKTNWSSIEAVQDITLRIVLGMLNSVSKITVLNTGRLLSIFDGLKKCNATLVSNKQSKYKIVSGFSTSGYRESRAQTRVQSDVKTVDLTSCRWYSVAGERGVSEEIPAAKTSAGAGDHYSGTALAAGHGHGGERGRASPVRGRVIASAVDGRQRESAAPARQPGGAFAR